MTRIHVVLDNIRSAFNVGSIFRTADAAGSTMLHICGISSHPPNLRLEKTALGATKNVPWKYYKNTQDALRQLQDKDIPVYAVEQTPASVDYRSIEYPDPLAIVLGHELRGVGQIPLDMSEKTINIPMRGIKESLNVATAAGIIIYEILRDIT